MRLASSAGCLTGFDVFGPVERQSFKARPYRAALDAVDATRQRSMVAASFGRP